MTRTPAHLLAAIIGVALASTACGREAAPPAATEAPQQQEAPPPTQPAQEPPAAGPKSTATTLAPPNEASAEFKEQVQQYLALRAKVENSLPKLTATSDQQKITERAALLAAGIAAARKDAKQGAIFTPKAAAEFRRILAADAASRTTREKVNLMAEVPVAAAAINAQYPVDSPTGPAALPSFPPNLLAVLPELPETVEYRFLGGSLVLRDASANLIVDYLPRVAPAPAGRGGSR